jgi:hypothetical protein
LGKLRLVSDWTNARSPDHQQRWEYLLHETKFFESSTGVYTVYLLDPIGKRAKWSCGVWQNLTASWTWKSLLAESSEGATSGPLPKKELTFSASKG